MNRDEILARVIRAGKEVVPDLKDVKLDESKSYRDLGINSMDLMEILVKTMKELKIKIPNDKLAGAQTIGQLVDLFVEASR